MGSLASRGAAYLGVWAVLVCAISWVTALPDALELLGSSRPVEVDEVTTGRDVVRGIVVLAFVTPVLFVALLAVGLRRPGLRRVLLVLAALSLAASAWVWRGIPDAGEWWPATCLGAAVLALAGAVVGDWPAGTRSGAFVAGGLLAAAGLTVAVVAWRGLEYQRWYWDLGNTAPMWLALVVGAALVPVGLVGPFLRGGRGLSAVATVVLLGLALVVLAGPVLWLLELDQVQRHEETESAWSVMPALVGGVGFLGAGVATRRGWWDLAGLTLAVGLAVGVGGILGSDLGRFIR